jgi:hypothetical protein
VLLQDPQELGLQRQRQLADLVEEDRAAVGLGEQAQPIGAGVGEGAALVAEQLALDQRLGHRRQVDRDERRLGPRRVVVDRARDQLLAGAALAGDQDRRGRAGDPADQSEDLLHGLGPRDHVLEAVLALDLALQPRDLSPQRALGQGLVDQEQELLDLERLGDVVVGAELDRLDRGLDRAEGGDHDDVRRVGEGADVADQIEAVEVGHPQVGDHQLDWLGARGLEAGGAAAGGPDPVAGVGQLLGQELAHRVVVLDDEHGRGGVSHGATLPHLGGHVSVRARSLLRSPVKAGR